jgi:hypothetical protein
MTKSLLVLPVDSVVHFLTSQHPQVGWSVICLVPILVVNYASWT